MANGTIGVSQIDVLTTSGTGTVSIVPPATNTNRTLTLPDETGTVVTTATTTGINASALSTGTIPTSVLPVVPIANGGTGSSTATFSGANITNLNASNLSTGTISTARLPIVPIANGGTGSSTATFSGANITSLNAGNISSGVLAVANGGTGSSTATFSGANITALNASNISTGTLAVARGGTGATTLTANNVILGNGTSAVQVVAPGTSGNILTSNGTTWTSAAPATPSAPAALSTASGSAPSYSARAWVNFNSVPLTGTYSQTGTTVTVTITSHGLATGQIANLDFTTGTSVDGSYTVTVTGTNTFTVTQASRTTSGNVTLRNSIRASGNVSSITDVGLGIFTINFTTAMSDTYYATFITANSFSNTNANILTAIQGAAAADWEGVNNKTTSAINIMCADSGSPTTLVDPFDVNVAIFR